jgi:RNA polymerase sigma-70 factor (ECF subfamily)
MFYPDPEEPVVRAVQQGDADALRELLRRHGSWIRGVIFAVLGDADTTEDVAQQVATSLWMRIGELKDPACWRSWVYRLARNAAIDAGRESARRRQLYERAAKQPAKAPAGSPSRELSEQETRQLIMKAIKGLPDIYREPFVLKHLEGWSYEQIGQTLEIPVDTVETRLVRARRLLRSALRERV